jgi:Uma2 family endonuclease
MSVDLQPYDALVPQVGLGPYRVSDYFQLDEDARCELIQGRLFVSPSPFYLHQTTILVLARMLESTIHASGGFLVLAPMDVELSEHSVVQPDMMAISHDRRAILADHIQGAPDLVIEVVSPGSVRRDRHDKLRLYCEAGVAEYWIIDPAERNVDFFVLKDGKYEVALESPGLIYGSTVFPQLTLNLTELWDEVARRLPRT